MKINSVPKGELLLLSVIFRYTCLATLLRSSAERLFRYGGVGGFGGEKREGRVVEVWVR